MSDQEEIRRKRLARLGQSAAERPRARAEPAAAPVAVPAPVAAPEPVAAPAAANTPEPRDVVMDEGAATPSADAWYRSELAYLLGTDAQSFSEPPTSPALIEPVFMELLLEGVAAPTITYLAGCWERAAKSRRLLKQRDPLRPEKTLFLAEFARLASLYGLMCFQEEGMFPGSEHVVADLLSDAAALAPFLVEVTTRAAENDTVVEFLEAVLPKACFALTAPAAYQTYPATLAVIETILSSKPCAGAVHLVASFHPAGLAANAFETSSLLGPVFALSPLQPAVLANSYTPAVLQSPAQLNATTEGLQSEHQVLLARLFAIADKIVRGSAASRNALLGYFAELVNKNHLRRGSHADRSTLALDALMCNVAMVLIRLLEPFLDSSLTKIDKIDRDYFQKQQLLELAEETRVNLQLSDVPPPTPAPVNFISDCFFLALAYLHYGIGGFLISDSRLRDSVRYVNRQMARLDALMASPRHAGARPLMQAQRKRLAAELDQLKAAQQSLACFFSNRLLQTLVFEFVCGALAFFLRTVDPRHAYPTAPLELPFHPDVVAIKEDAERLRDILPVPWKYFPEFAVEGLVNWCAHVVHYPRANPMIGHSRLGTFVELAVVIIRCPELVGNPHLKGRLVECLFHGLLPPLNDANGPGFMLDEFLSVETARKHLLYGLLDFYVTVEKTGALLQFYDKFNSRFHILMICEQVWKLEEFRHQLQHYASASLEFFIRFVARMLNDTTYLLDEAYSDLAQIHNLQVELTNRERTGSEEGAMEGTTDELVQRLEGIERQSSSYVQLSNKTMDLFLLFTKEVPRGFVSPEIVDRLSGMLNYNLVALVGPKCRDLKVKNPEKYQFDPKALLLKFIRIYLNLAGEREFVSAVGLDGRSFHRSLFTRAGEISTRHHLLDDRELAQLVVFADAAEASRAAEEMAEQELGEAPDEFLDPLMFTLMVDPVVLPGLKVVIDRATIKAHLLLDATDPFNRMPLRLEDVQEATELKARIEKWRRGEHPHEP